MLVVPKAVSTTLPMPESVVNVPPSIVTLLNWTMPPVVALMVPLWLLYVLLLPLSMRLPPLVASSVPVLVTPGLVLELA